MRKQVLLLAFLAFAGCSTLQEMYTDLPKAIASAKASLAAAEHTALIYVSLPVCGKTTATLCRDPAITAKIGVADNIAFNAVETADKAQSQDALNAAITAVAGLTNLTDNLPTSLTAAKGI